MRIVLVVIDAVTAAGTLGAAIFACLSASEAKKATAEAARAVQATLVGRLLKEHGSAETLTAHLLLRAWESQHDKEFAKVFQQLRATNTSEVNAIDAARRRLALYLRTVYELSRHGLLDDRFVQTVMPRDTAEFCCDIVEPMEAAIRENYDKTTFLWVATRYDLPRASKEVMPSWPVRR